MPRTENKKEMQHIYLIWLIDLFLFEGIKALRKLHYTPVSLTLFHLISVN